jgi:hypothetical protein
MDTNEATTTDRVFRNANGMSLTFSQIEADNLAHSSPEERATASADVCSDGHWAVSLDCGEFSPEDDTHFFHAVFTGSEEDAKEVARLVRESAQMARS